MIYDTEATVIAQRTQKRPFLFLGTAYDMHCPYFIEVRNLNLTYFTIFFEKRVQVKV